MSKILRDVLLWLFVVNLGIAFGAGLYEARVVVPGWAAIRPQLWPNTGLMFWVYVTTVPLTLLTIANAVAAWVTPGPARRWYLAAVAIVLVERIATFSYFIPTIVRLMSAETLPQTEIAEALSQWQLMNHGRHVLALLGWLAALRTFSLPRF
jgi:hypothetical protein